MKLRNISEYWNGTVILEVFKHVFEISRENAGWIFDRLDTSHRCCVGWSVKYETIVHRCTILNILVIILELKVFVTVIINILHILYNKLQY